MSFEQHLSRLTKAESQILIFDRFVVLSDFIKGQSVCERGRGALPPHTALTEWVRSADRAIVCYTAARCKRPIAGAHFFNVLQQQSNVPHASCRQLQGRR
jgi:hypothetical protein